MVSNGGRGCAVCINAGIFEGYHGKNRPKTARGAFGILKMTHTPVVIITGASRGLGAATARWLARAGAAVTLISRSKGTLDGVAKEVQRLGGMPLVFKADISDAGACHAAVSKTLDRFGKLDALVNNAGIGGGGSMLIREDRQDIRTFNSPSDKTHRPVSVMLGGTAAPVESKPR